MVEGLTERITKLRRVQKIAINWNFDYQCWSVVGI